METDIDCDDTGNFKICPQVTKQNDILEEILKVPGWCRKKAYSSHHFFKKEEHIISHYSVHFDHNVNQPYS